MSSHTPGPWLSTHRKGADGMYRTEVLSDEYGGIATCDWTPKHCGGGVTSTYREANARLIAAAPDMFDVLQEFKIASDIQDNNFDGDAWLKRVDAAIKKVTSQAS